MLIMLFIVLPGVLGGQSGNLDRAVFGPAQFSNHPDRTALVLLALAAFWWKAQPVDDNLLDRRTLEALDQLLAKTRFTMFPFLRATGCRRPCCNGPKASGAARRFLRWCC